MRPCAPARIFVWAALVCFGLLSLIGSGTMLARADDGRIAVVLCTGEGPRLVMMAPDGAPAPDQGHPAGDKAAQKPCEWARVDPPAPPGPLPLPARAATLPRAAEPAAAPLLHARRIAVLAPLARGPPAA